MACNSKPSMQENHEGRSANRLIESTSPYLLQHAYNPVDWHPWGEEALERARKEDKPIIVSIGYSSCHWCHVMERESFENDSIARLMNENFVNIKVDREERPDVDQIYMDAVQAMGLGGGWPLNVFLTPDQKPFYGGTYFPPAQWAALMKNITKAFSEKREEVEKSADDLTNALSKSEIIKYRLKETDREFKQEVLDSMYRIMAAKFDPEDGGFDKAPKFPMPNNWLFLLRYYHITNNQNAIDHITLTLDKIAMGGIFDQIGGGWARYSTDGEWLAPHFEKMLYDNGQLVSLYSEAYQITGSPLYKEVVYKTIEWLKREMLDSSGGFYSALDADSEGEEGKFYVWNLDEFNNVLKEDAELLAKYYDVTEEGNWEAKNILRRLLSDEEIARENEMDPDDLRKTVISANRNLLEARQKRVRPGMDNKVLVGWNGIMMKGLVDAYEAFDEPEFLLLAEKNAQFIIEKMANGEGIYRSFISGKASIAAYLEDYAYVIDGLSALYQVTFEEKWLNKAKELAEYTLEHFFDVEEGLFFFTDNSSEKLITRKKEVFDNVIPASNSQMALNLYQLGVIYDNEEFKVKASSMISKMSTLMKEEPAYLTNWGILYAYLSTPTAEISIVGPTAQEVQQQFVKRYLPNKVIMGAEMESDLPLMNGKYAMNGETTIYVCYNKTCKLPVTSVEKAYQQLQ
ncbi:MAG: thioredoxin domain-containing protein [Bacteroidota bacterium]